MSFFRPATAFSRLTRRAATITIRQPLAVRNLSATPFRFAQGYGDGEGDPKGENPQDQGTSSNATRHAEHPGPEPPSEGQGTGAGPNKGGNNNDGQQKSSADASAQSGGSRSKEAKETGSSPTGGDVKNSEGEEKQAEGKSDGKSLSEKSKGGARPVLSDKSEPAPVSEEQKAEVEKHNKEYEEGHDRAPPAKDAPPV